MNPTQYSGTRNTADALREEEAIAKRQQGVTPVSSYVAPQPPDMTPAWAKNLSSNVSANPTEAYGLNDVEMARYNESKAGSIAPQQSEEEVFNNTLRRYQGEIDATNNIFASKLREANTAGLNRSGSQYAQQARGGLLGSDFGNAQDEKINQYNTQVTNDIRDEQSLAISKILGKARSGAKEELAAKRAARDTDYAAYKELLTTSASRKSAKTNAYAKELLAKGTTLEKLLGLDPTEFSGTGLSKQEVINAFKEAELENNKAKAEIAKSGQFDLSEGQARYDVNGNLIASRGKTYAPKSGGTGGFSGGSTLVNGKPVSSAAQNILNLMNTSGGTVDDYVKGTSIASQNLRNELFQALSNQGGVTAKSNDLFKEAKTVIDKSISENDYKKFGYSSKLGGQFTTGFGDMMSRAKTVNAILARDNLGLLKGAMSDKDIAFIEAMSNGVPQGTISESYAKERFESIQQKLQDKINQYQPQGGNTTQPATNNPVDSTLSEFGL